MSSPPLATNHTSPPPCPDHLRPTPASLVPIPANALPPATLAPVLPPFPTTPADPPVEGGVFEGVEDVVGEEAIPYYGHGFMATGGSFGRVTSNEVIQARKHLEAVGHELLKANLERKMKQGMITEDVPSFEVSEDDMEEVEEGEFEGDESLSSLTYPPNEEFRKLMNGALEEMRKEQYEIREVDAILGEVERERARKGKEVVDFPVTFPATGITIPASPPPWAGGAMAGEGLLVEGIATPNSNSKFLGLPKSRAPFTSSLTSSPIPSITSLASFPPLVPNSNFPPPSLSSATITSITPITSPFPPNFLNSNLSPPSSSFPPISNSTSISTKANPIPTGQHGLPLTGQLLTGQSQRLTSQSKSTLPVNAGKSGLSSLAGPNKPPTPWIDLLKASTSRMELNYVKPQLNANGFLALDKGTSKEGEDFWKNTLVGYSIDKRLPFKLVHQRILAVWEKFGIKDVRVNKEGFYFFTFISEEGASLVLKGGPWIILGQQLCLKPWKWNFDFCKEEFKTLPNWIKFYGIPTTYWSPAGFSAIASNIGVPLYMDELTSSAKLLDFARICVDMKVGSTFPLSFKVQTEFEEEFEVRVEYSWRPRQCSFCNVFGHSTQMCPKNPSKASAPNHGKSLAKLPTKKPAQVYQPKVTKPSQTSPLPMDPTQPAINHLPTPSVACVSPSTSNSFEVLEDGGLVDEVLGDESLVVGHSKDKDVDEGSGNISLVCSNMGTIEDRLLEGPHSDVVPTTKGTSGGETSVFGDDLGIDLIATAVSSSGEDLDSKSPILWGHKVKMVDELDRRNKKKIRKSALRKKKRAKEAISLSSIGKGVDMEGSQSSGNVKEVAPGEAQGSGGPTPSPK